MENGTNGWTAAGGFTRFGGSTSEVVQHYYLAENRVYNGYDKTLQTGPYNFGWANTRPDWVERFPYQNGLLVTYVDGQYSDNNTSAHPGHGQVLPVDARYLPIKFPNGTLLGNRRQPFDATFGQEKTDAVTFHLNGVATKVKSVEGHPDLLRPGQEEVLDRGQPAELRPGGRLGHQDHGCPDQQQRSGHAAQGPLRQVSRMT